LITDALIVFFAARVIDQSQIITRTNQRDISQSIVSANRQLQELAEPGEIVSTRAVAATAGALLRRKLKGRTRTIATTEVQVGSESSKAAETSILTRNRASLPRPALAIPQPQVVVPELPVGLAPPPVEKEWVTAGDEVVRVSPFSHVAADGQKVNINESFNVGGQLLRIPGDTSQGASLSNVINCRCASVRDKDDVLNARKAIFDAETRIEAEAEVAAPEFGFVDGRIPTRAPVPAPRPVPTPIPSPIPAKPTTIVIDRPPVKAPANVQNIRTAAPAAPVTPVSRSAAPTRVIDQKVARPDKPPKLPKEVKLTGDQDAYLEYYKGDGFYKSNEVLRNPSAFSAGEVESARKMRDSINRAVKKSAIQEDGVLFRGIRSQEVFDNAESLIGKNIPIPTPQSTASNAGSALGWSGLTRLKTGQFLSANPGKSVMFKIRTRKGQHALDLESLSIGNTGEREVLLGSGGRYKVTNVRELKDLEGRVSGKVIEVDYFE
jgi:hypothetical protein